MQPKELAILAAKALDDKKGEEIKVIEVTELTTLADYFVICTGSSNTQINALCDAVEERLEREAGEKPLHREGHRGGIWVLLDYGQRVLLPGAAVERWEAPGHGRDLCPAGLRKRRGSPSPEA